MKYLLPGFLLLIVGTAVVSLAFFYWKFRYSPASLDKCSKTRSDRD